MPSSTPAETTALFVTHRGQRCGVYQFGARLYAALSTTEQIRWHYAECNSREEFLAAANIHHPDIVLLNYHPFTLPWATGGLSFPSALICSVFHEANQAAVDQGEAPAFDLMLCPDPTLSPYDPSWLPVPRFIPAPLADRTDEPETFTVGSFGFGTPGKGFDRLCGLVNDQFETARIRINIPPHDQEAMTPHAAVAAIIVACRGRVTKPGIVLDITHDFMDEAALLDFLGSNTINAFLYDEAPNRGISSCTDYALASGRPVAISRTSMFRHLHGVNPSICVEDRSLRAIAASGTAALRHLRADYAATAAGQAWNRAILAALQMRRDALSVPDGRGFNKILDDRSRGAYGSTLGDLSALAPAMLARKIERANIQQAFVLDTVRHFATAFAAPRMLAVGSFEDTAVASLRAQGFQIEEIDPQVDGRDLEAFYTAFDTGTEYDLILCTSVLEHVPDDEGFVRMTGELLAPGGVAIFTVDFSNRYPTTGVRPAADCRLYTTNDLRQRLARMLPGCMLADVPSWDDGDDDFEYEGCRYSFASWVFRKVEINASPAAPATRIRQRGTHWKALIAADWRRAGEAERRCAAAERSLAEVTARMDALLRDLRTEEGSKALRIVLPLARLIRRAHRLLAAGQVIAPGAPPHDGEAASPDMTVALTAPPPVSPPVANSSPHPLRLAAHWTTMAVYKLVRPVVRPLAWRMRNFLIGDLAEELRRSRTGEGQAEMRQLAVQMERVLLTLAMESASSRAVAAEPPRSGQIPTH